jgi:preprotein translocase subunit SecE
VPKVKALMNKITEYIQEVRTELVNKVSWPTWQELQGSALVVLISSVIIGLIVFVMDYSFEYLMKLVYSLLS